MKKAAVVGAGIMGHGICELMALAGLEVTLVDVKEDILEKAVNEIKWSLEKFVERKRIKEEDAETALSKIKTSLDLEETVRDVDLVVEAVSENMDLKKSIFKKLDDSVPEHTILASNTSSLSITEMAKATGRPDKVVGMHFFNPPMLMALVEVIRGDETSEDTMNLSVELVKRLGKTPIVVRKDVRGFIVNRILGATLNEAFWVVHRGEATMEEVDAAVKHNAGFPMGAFELADVIGLDVMHEVLNVLEGAYENALEECPDVERLFKDGNLGRKTGKGFYDWKEGRPKISSQQADKFDIQRLHAVAINEAARLIHEGVAGPEDIDQGMKLGTGWPLGPCEQGDKLGLDVIHEKLKELHARYGEENYRPCPLLEDYVGKGWTGKTAGRGFYEYLEGKRFETTITEKEDGVEWITLNRPHKMNALNLEMIDELSMAVDEADADEGVRCIVIKSAGDRAFCTGLDLTVFTDLTPVSAYDVSEKGQRLMNKIETSPKPFVAAIHGFCLGGGLELALACDFRLADEAAQLGSPEITLGLIPGWSGTQRLSKIIGIARAKEFIMLGGRVSSEEALKIGLVHRVVPVDKLMDEARSLAQRLSDGPPVALKLAKHAINVSSQFPSEVGLKVEAEAFGLLASTDDVVEGISAFFEKRKPEFKGK